MESFNSKEYIKNKAEAEERLKLKRILRNRYGLDRSVTIGMSIEQLTTLINSQQPVLF